MTETSLKYLILKKDELDYSTVTPIYNGIDTWKCLHISTVSLQTRKIEHFTGIQAREISYKNIQSYISKIFSKPEDYISFPLKVGVLWSAVISEDAIAIQN